MAKQCLKTVQNGPQTAFEHPQWSRVIFGKSYFWPFSDPLWGHLGLFWGQITPFTGERRAKHDQVDSIPGYGRACPGAMGPRWGPCWGRWGRVGLDGVKTGKPRVKGTSRCPSEFHPKTQPPDPPAPISEPSGPTWGHLRLF